MIRRALALATKIEPVQSTTSAACGKADTTAPTPRRTGFCSSKEFKAIIGMIFPQAKAHLFVLATSGRIGVGVLANPAAKVRHLPARTFS